MALIDHEAVVADVEEYILSRNSHGQRDLLKKLAELRKEHRISETDAERYVRTQVEVLPDSQPSERDREPVGAHG